MPFRWEGWHLLGSWHLFGGPGLQMQTLSVGIWSLWIPRRRKFNTCLLPVSCTLGTVLPKDHIRLRMIIRAHIWSIWIIWSNSLQALPSRRPSFELQKRHCRALREAGDLIAHSIGILDCQIFWIDGTNLWKVSSVRSALDHARFGQKGGKIQSLHELLSFGLWTVDMDPFSALAVSWEACQWWYLVFEWGLCRLAALC